MKFYIKEARTAAKMTQKQLADILGITDATLSGYETGAHDPKSNMLVEIAKICNTTTDYLLGLETRMYLHDKLDSSLGSNSPAAQKLRQIGAALSGNESELVDIYRSLNDLGQTALMGTARGLAANPDMKKDGTSNDKTTA